MQFDRQIIISAAGSRKATQWPAQTLYWSELVERLRTAVRGTETLAEYLKLPKSRQDELKDVGGFVAGTLTGDRRKASNVIGRDVLTLDLDNIPAGGTRDVLTKLEGLGCAYATYSTRKHEENKPRLRVLVPLNRTASADEYEPLARKLASLIGMSLADPTTFEASRLMYWPSCSADSQYVFMYGDKPFLDTDGLLAMYGDWRNIQEWPEVPGANQAHVRLAAKQGNPLEKKGVVGAFCRQYDIYQAIETFLPGIYTPTDVDDRLTYLGGSTVGGAIVYEHGLFLYSHHATDPCSGRLVNAFDLVRMHKYGDLDDEAKPDTPVNKLPSFTQMAAFALNDAGVGALINQERYERVVADFGEPVTDVPATDDDFNWIRKLELNPNTGKPVKSSRNIMIALENDSNIKGKIKLDEFSNIIVGQGPLPWHPREKDEGLFQWSSIDDDGLMVYLERVLEFWSESKVNAALAQVASKNRFDPVMDYLNGLSWDGTKRLDTLFIDYLGANDTPYVRAVTRKSFTAAVTRVMEPGCKYDTMVVLVGNQGQGKSTIFDTMAKSWFSDDLKTFDGKEAAELLPGNWILEIAEMHAYNRSDREVIKSFLSRKVDNYRPAYARKAEKFPRRCVFFGTTNEHDFLNDATGDRRFWPVDTAKQEPIKNVFDDLPIEVDQIWAEAVMNWRLGESLILKDDLLEEAKKAQEEHKAVDVWESEILEFVDRLVPPNWNDLSKDSRRLFWNGEFGKIAPSPDWVKRDRICAQEIWVELFYGDLKYIKRADVLRINAILEKIPGWKKQHKPLRYGPYGLVKGGCVKVF
ncbi:virulence-associated E family protein [Bacillus marasmi]|uniref:virulence-associated E family protein n=1 Tax=Bacillus marasmi TaxID=1926279 RepID=UPI0011CB942C|nr:virulence-associated E family protein [Bacillus marasmi]